jgi:hypothetical protein
MFDRLGRILWVYIRRSTLHELAFVIGFIGVLLGIAFLGQLVGGNEGCRAGCIVAGLLCFFALALLLPQKIRTDRKGASRQANQAPPLSVSQRFRKVLVKSFAHWAGSWISLWIGATIYGFIQGKANARWFMLSLNGIMALVILIAVGIPLALLFAAAFCWFKDTDPKITGAVSDRDQAEEKDC